MRNFNFSLYLSLPFTRSPCREPKLNHPAYRLSSYVNCVPHLIKMNYIITLPIGVALFKKSYLLFLLDIPKNLTVIDCKLEINGRIA